MKIKKSAVIAWLVDKATSTIGEAVGVIVFAALYTVFKSFRDDQRLNFYLQNPTELVSPIIVAMLSMLVIALIALQLKSRQQINSFGVRLFSRHDDSEAKKADWALLCKDIKLANEEKSFLWILGATGKDTFSGSTSPLFDVLRTYDGDMRILMLRPEVDSFKQRRDGLNVAEHKYLDDVLDSIDYCRDLLIRKNRSIEVKLYDSTPIWKMIMTNRVLWVQFYKPGVHVDDTPMYCFKALQNESMLFDGFRAAFNNKWIQDQGKVIDLKSFVRFDWKKSCN